MVYSGFVAEGKYTLTVEARNPSGVTQKISHSFYVDFVPPAVFEEGVKIDREKIRQAQTPVEEHEIAAAEFEKAYQVWSEVYDHRRRQLKDSYDPEELIELFDEIAITELSPRFIEEFVDKGVGQAMGKLLLPKLVYDITSRAGKTAVLSVLSIQTNAAAVRTVYCYKMWKAAEKKEQTIAENNQSRAMISSSGDFPPFLSLQVLNSPGLEQGVSASQDMTGRNEGVVSQNKNPHLNNTLPGHRDAIKRALKRDPFPANKTAAAGLARSGRKLSVFYHSNVDGNFNIYRSDSSGHHAVTLTTHSADDFCPEVSFSRTRIVFRSRRSGSRTDLWAMRIDGSDKRQLTHSGSGRDFTPRWSSDDRLITFSSYRPWGVGGRVMMVESSGGAEQSLYFRSGFDSYAAGFTAHNRRVVFFRQRRYGGGGATLMSVGVDGRNPLEIANVDALVGDSGFVREARLSSDGKSVVFAYYSNSRKKYTGIYSIDVDGKNFQHLSLSGSYPSWFEDGKITYIDAAPSGGSGIWIMNSDGLEKRLLFSNNHKLGGAGLASTH